MYIRVKVNPSAKKEIFKQINEDHFEISVKEKAERNLANDRIVEIFSNHFNVFKNKVRIVNGHRSSTKLLIIDKN
ncbi:MAG: hypothetical protein UR25_C0001G0038 [Candidatus Nomurabacteria bacterium GW2011_GWE1_32_28]|uniref:YggU family protein n=1 Tax=Candidatus Nomurabacteria bacterium GW2011_GWF1_31_48 TaxID=1618767 RepID=A0A0G0BFU6_9BACT|nr:MAG: hypothetical protein UR10_C0005G0010 [Candidatus Nomurabacteria bacterium GW2011_GWF2_30_133]KKP28362.1 MAG: hypothetical protein UR18_C0005G0010 [Candidatus Nomurabacteria bacterium GW2011_GWE2_31_40]KKP29947.1 MAG: hypothetical protein UR19_C0006G0010 [Candidatus Nomurabacteria bacterium GW2011_GWF1_31_48]KKP35126.1 MAG: hypothetical protein UR25_C0001G0038 [Candidatus Nomurabacteria bacterium GW2011_GWE1_32_28]HAS80938.1 hypothetical protein [Candidatus Nomurabacteria bacterium]